MRLYKTIAALLVFVIFISFLPVSAVAEAANGDHAKRITVLVLLDDGVPPSEAAAKISAATPGMKVKYIYDSLINGFAAEIDAGDCGFIAGFAGVKAVSAENVYSAPVETLAEDVLDVAEGSAKISLRADETGGEGTVIAVLDSGFDVSHPAFRLTKPASAAIKKADITAVRYKLNARAAAFVSPKIPFAYDYAGSDTNVYSIEPHGTSMAGIIAGNGEQYEGVAPEAQLLLMKVFDDNDLSTESDVIAALEDAVILGADVINLSLGSAVGADNGYPLDPALAEALENAAALGVIVNGAAGNDGHIGLQSDINSKLGLALPSTSTMDYGTISSPASVGAVNAVASKNSDVEYKYCVDFDGMKVPFSDTTGNYKELGGKPFTELLDGKTYKYVAVPGLGTTEDCALVGDSLRGAVALIKRGELTFVEKVNNAYAFGAVAAVVWDNIEDNPSQVGMELSGARIPAIFIEYKYGVELAAKGSGSMTIIDKLLEKFPTSDNGRIADTSSWGVTPGFALKPDFASTGINVFTIAPGGNYTIVSGTSAASAYASGETAVLYSMLRKRGIDADAAEVRRRLMNTAKLLTDAESGLYYSPRCQGAGEINAAAAAVTESALYNTPTGLAKSEYPSLGGTSVTLELTLENSSDTEKTYTISCAVQGDAYETVVREDDSYSATVDLCQPRAFEKATATLDGNQINIYSEAFKGAIVTVGAGESVQLKIDIALDKETAIEYGSMFENGFYLEGFVLANPSDGTGGVSLPYVCFTGDWDAMRIFDATVYDTDAAPYYSTSFFYSLSEDFLTDIVLGQNRFADKKVLDKNCVAFSPDGDGEADVLYLSLALLRSARDITGVITDSEGNIVADMGELPYKSKSLASGYSFSTLDFMAWDGSAADNPYYIFPDGAYTLTINAYPAYEGSTVQTYEFSFVIDTVDPVVKSMKMVVDPDGTEVLEITVSDETALQGALLYLDHDMFFANIYSVDYTESRKTTDTYRFNIDGWRESGRGYAYVDIYDYAMNRLTVKVPLAELAMGTE